MKKPDAPTRLREIAKAWRDEELHQLRAEKDTAARDCRIRASTLEAAAEMLATERVHT